MKNATLSTADVARSYPINGLVIKSSGSAEMIGHLYVLECVHIKH